MEIEANQDATRARLIIRGDIDEQGAEKLKAQVNKLDLAALEEVVLDLREVRHIGSSGIGKILLLYKHLATSDAHLRVENLSSNIFELFKELKLDSLFTITQA